MNRSPSSISRRNWILGTLAGCGLWPRLAMGEDAAIEAIRAKARKAGMEGFDETETANYRGIGDAPQKFREDALAICEAVAADYRKHFSDKGFELKQPKQKLTVVILMGPKSYAAFEGGFIGDSIGGHFDLDENRLVMFNFRGPGGDPLAPIPEQDNTLALVHETIHQLTYNTGLLDLKADIPLCVSEGLATYGETWRPRHKGSIGSTNLRRRLGFDNARKQGTKWIPLPTLLADDKLLNDDKIPHAENIQQIAYAESWMFVSKMLKDPAKLPKFRAYLAALREKPGTTKRIELATEYLGDLLQVDKDIRSAR